MPEGALLTGTVETVLHDLANQRASAQAWIEVITGGKINIEIAADFAADAHRQSVDFRIEHGFDDLTLAVADGEEQLAGPANELGALAFGNDTAFAILRVDQQITVIDRGIDHSGFAQIHSALAVENQQAFSQQDLVERDPFMDALDAMIRDQSEQRVGRSLGEQHAEVLVGASISAFQ